MSVVALINLQQHNKDNKTEAKVDYCQEGSGQRWKFQYNRPPIYQQHISCLIQRFPQLTGVRPFLHHQGLRQFVSLAFCTQHRPSTIISRSASLASVVFHHFNLIYFKECYYENLLISRFFKWEKMYALA